VSNIDHGRVCTCCKVPYVKPCDGKDATCPNKIHHDKMKEESK
jgi:hypothetical protein